MFPYSPLFAHGEVRGRNFNLHVLNDSHKTLVARAKVIHEWRTNGGVLLIGYEQFRLLSQRKMPKSRRKINPELDDERNMKLFDGKSFFSSLLLFTIRKLVSCSNLIDMILLN